MTVTFHIPRGTPRLVIAILNYHQRRVLQFVIEKINSIIVEPYEIKSIWFIDQTHDNVIWNAEMKRLEMKGSYLKTLLQTLMAEHIQMDIMTRLAVRTLNNGAHIIGVYAIRDIPVGTFPFKTLLGQCFAEDPIIEIPKDSPEIQDVKHFFNEFFLGDDTTYPLPALGPNSMNVAYFLNHSDTPNVEIVKVSECTYSVYRTSRPIRRGEELTIRYNDFESKHLPFQTIQKQLDPMGTYLIPRPKTTTSRKRPHT